MERTIGATELRHRLTDVLQAVREERAAYVIETFERGQAALINLEEYRQFRQYMAERAAFFRQLEETAGRNAARNRDLSADSIILEELERFPDTHSRAEPANSMELVEVALDPSTRIVYCPVAKDLLSGATARYLR